MCSLLAPGAIDQVLLLLGLHTKIRIFWLKKLIQVPRDGQSEDKHIDMDVVRLSPACIKLLTAQRKHPIQTRFSSLTLNESQDSLLL